VVTGVSGSGKSSLAFDTVYAEGQRRYVETFSPYARQFLDRMDRPRAERIDGIPPAIAIDQTNPVRTSRSTVGTMTELNDHLKLLFARAARLFCHGCGREVRRDTPESIWGALHAPKRRRGAAGTDLLRGAGAGDDDPGSGQGAAGTAGLHPLPARGAARIEVIQDRLRLTPRQPGPRRRGAGGGAGAGTRPGARLPAGQPSAIPARPGASPRTCTARTATSIIASRRRTCSRSTRRWAPASLPRLRAHHRHRLVAGGAGRVQVPARRRRQADPVRQLRRGAGGPDRLRASPRRTHGRPLARAVGRGPRLGAGGRRREGGQDKRVWYGIRRFFGWLEGRSYKMHVRVLLSRYRSYDTCTACNGARLKDEALDWRVGVTTWPMRCSPRAERFRHARHHARDRLVRTAGARHA
jgi:excinuclease ABC subunit A